MPNLIRVLVKGSNDLKNKGGGALFAIQDKIQYLKKLGADVIIDINQQESPANYDLVHIQQSIHNGYEVYTQLREAIKWNKPVVFKPLYNPIRDIDLYLRQGQSSSIRIIYKLLNNYFTYLKLRSIFYSIYNRNFSSGFKQIFSRYQKQQIAILENSFLIPDSYMELKDIEEETNIKIKNYRVVHASLGINEDIESVSPSIFFNKYGITDVILCAGRIEPLKNQVNFIKALQQLNVQIVLAGAMFSYHKAYNTEFLKLIANNPNFHWIGPVNREMLFSAYKNAHVVALPSWTETAGMTGLEGGYFDCNIVATKRGACKEYFKENAWYLDPSNPESIRQAVIDAYNSLKGCRSFKDRIITDYSLEKTSKDLYDAYSRSIDLRNCSKTI